jgi:hypothetical protein
MNKDKLIAKMLNNKVEKNNTIDLDAYGNGLADMYDRIIKLFAIHDVTASTLRKKVCADDRSFDCTGIACDDCKYWR